MQRTYLTATILITSSFSLTLGGCAFTPYNTELESTPSGPALIAPEVRVAPSSANRSDSASKEIPLVQVSEDYESPLPIVFPASADPNLKVDGDFYVTIEENETLESVARTYTGNIDNTKELARLNGLNYPTSLKAGQQLRIPNIMKVLDLATVEATDDSLPIAKTIPLTE